MSSGIEFSSNRYGGLKEAAGAMREGRLPGVWGVAQSIVGHWVISKDERGVMAYGRAALNTFGTLYDYRESQREVKSEGREPMRAWLKKEGYNLAFKGVDGAFTSFVRSAISDIPYEKHRIRNMLGQFGEGALMGFSIGGSKTAYFIDDLSHGPGAVGGESSNTLWKGPYCKLGDFNTLEGFIGKHIWERLDTGTLRLSRQHHFMGDDIRLDALSDEFDFLSCDDTWNDVRAMGKRQGAFLKKGRSRCLLFRGAPGTGKSTLARAIAREIGRKVLVADHEAMGVLDGGTISRIISLLDPGVLVLNDVDRADNAEYRGLLDALEQRRDKVLLTCLTVNDVSRLDPALLRPGRVSQVIQVEEPGQDSRAKLLRYYSDKYKVRFTDSESERMLTETEGFSPSDIRELCEVADAVGIESAFGEIPRLKEQRTLYAGDACEEFNRRRGGETSKSGQPVKL